MREIILEGKLYKAETPLYIIHYGKDKKDYAFSEQELEEWKQTHSVKYELTHCKGLGEVSAKVLKEICFDVERYKQITVEDVEEADKIIRVLMGSSIPPRKKFIYENATRLGFSY